MRADEPHPVGDAALGGAAIVVLGYLAVAIGTPQQPFAPRLAAALDHGSAADRIVGQPPE